MNAFRQFFAASLFALVPVTAFAAEPTDVGAAARDVAPLTETAMASMPGGELAKHWAEQHGLPHKEIVLTLPNGERVSRVVVAVTPETWENFKATFTKNRFIFNPNLGNGYSIFDGQGRLYARHSPFADEHKAASGLDLHAGRSIVVDLSSNEYAHAQKWFAARADPGDVHFCGGHGSACTDYLGNIELKSGRGGKNATTARVIPLADQARIHELGSNGKNPKTPSIQQAETVVAKGGYNLSQKLGIKRSRDPVNNFMNMAHVAGAAAGVVAVHMSPVPITYQQFHPETRSWTRVTDGSGTLHERFHALTREQLLGPPPPEGAAAVQRPRVQPAARTARVATGARGR